LTKRRGSVTTYGTCSLFCCRTMHGKAVSGETRMKRTGARTSYCAGHTLTFTTRRPGSHSVLLKTAWTANDPTVPIVPLRLPPSGSKAAGLRWPRSRRRGMRDRQTRFRPSYPVCRCLLSSRCSPCPWASGRRRAHSEAPCSSSSARVSCGRPQQVLQADGSRPGCWGCSGNARVFRECDASSCDRERNTYHKGMCSFSKST